MKFIVSYFKQDISSISDGKRVDVSMSFKVLLKKPSLSQTKLIEGMYLLMVLLKATLV